MTDIKVKHQFMNIEFLRIMAILAIIMLHIFNSGMGLHSLSLNVHLYDKLFKMTSNGQKGVDFFFIISGLFLYMSMIKLPEQSLFQFICKKLIRLWPVMIFATILAFVLNLLGLLHFTYWDNIYALLFLNGTPLAINQGNISVTWYCSALMVHFILWVVC